MNILRESGYDTALAIEQLDAKNIADLEKYVNENLRHLLRNSLYEKQSNDFRFLPGHRSILLHLPAQIKRFNHSEPVRIFVHS